MGTRSISSREPFSGKDADSFEMESDINGMRGLIETTWIIGAQRAPLRSEQFKRTAREQDYEGYRLCEESTAELEVVMNNETRRQTSGHFSLRFKRRKTRQDVSRRMTYCPAKTGGFLAK
ncbi:Uncharacterized protein HZ326_20985 [Fusarium oxysporum f. sp. albedinis]|nr:Uncharacterized protein HZ326_20985 [Fusarium oxysporum f. sp. albedinis]